MTSVSFNILCIYSFLLSSVLYIYFFQTFTKLTNFFKLFWNLQKTIKNPLLFSFNYFLYILWLFGVIIFFLKSTNTGESFLPTIYFFSLVLWICISVFCGLLKYSTNTRVVSLFVATCFWLFFCTLGLTLLKDLLTFFIFLEFVGVIYYFFFLTTFTTKTLTLIKLKNLVSTYLWLSFFILFFFSLAVSNCIWFYGTLSFTELQLSLKAESSTFLLLFIMLSLKVGAPGFHFLKLEVYQYIDFLSLVLFSSLTLLLNTFIYIYLLAQFSDFLKLLNIYLIFIIFIVNILLLLRGNQNLSLFQFLAFSGVNTWVFIFMLSLY